MLWSLIGSGTDIDICGGTGLGCGWGDSLVGWVAQLIRSLVTLPRGSPKCSCMQRPGQPLLYNGTNAVRRVPFPVLLGGQLQTRDTRLSTAF